MTKRLATNSHTLLLRQTTWIWAITGYSIYCKPKIHTQTHTHTHTYIHTYIYTCTQYIYMCVYCMYVCRFGYVCVCVHTHTLLYMWVYTERFAKYVSNLRMLLYGSFQWKKKCSITILCQFINRYTATSILTFHCAKLYDVSSSDPP